MRATGLGRIPSTRSTCERGDIGDEVRSMYVRACFSSPRGVGAEAARILLVTPIVLAKVLGEISSDVEVVLGVRRATFIPIVDALCERMSGL